MAISSFLILLRPTYWDKITEIILVQFLVRRSTGGRILTKFQKIFSKKITIKLGQILRLHRGVLGSKSKQHIATRQHKERLHIYFYSINQTKLKRVNVKHVHGYVKIFHTALLHISLCVLCDTRQIWQWSPCAAYHSINGP